MASYDVKIQATVTKTIRVDDVDNEEDAIEQGHTLFSILPETGIPEKYDEQTLSCEKVT